MNHLLESIAREKHAPKLIAYKQLGEAALARLRLSQIQSLTRFTRDMDASRQHTHMEQAVAVRRNDEGFRINLWMSSIAGYDESGLSFTLQTQGSAAQNTFRGCAAKLSVVDGGALFEAPVHFDYALPPDENTLRAKEVVHYLHVVHRVLHSPNLAVGELVA